MAATLEVNVEADFLAAAEAVERQPVDILADLMREFVQRERTAYDRFLQRKVEEGRRCIDRGEIEDGDDVEAEFAKLRGDLAGRSRTVS